MQIDKEPLLDRFIKLGLPKEDLLSICQEAYSDLKLGEEPDDETLLVKTIKTQNKEQKAKQSYEQNIRFF